MSAFTESPQEKGNRRIAAVLAVGLHVMIGVLLFFLAAWKAPDPPIPDYGIELNFGLVDAGSGDVQPEPQSSETTPVEETTEADQPEEKVTESEPEPEPVVAPVESPVVVKKPKPEVKKPEPKKPVEEKKIEPVIKPVPEKPKPVVDSKAVYNPGENKTNETKPSSQGDAINAKGDQGSKEGKIDAQALYGVPGGGGGGDGTGTALSLAGWRWDREPSVALPATEKNGKLVFEIEVDENGDIVKLVPIERGLSPAAEKLCREEILRRRFTPLGDNVPPISKGRVTFRYKAQ
ncbi:MAG: hypothetical protein ACO263_11020 [Cyclobacteriaceae bacterium]